VDERGGVGDGREDAELGRAERRPGAQHDLTFADVLATVANVLAGVAAGHDGDAPALCGLGVLLPHDGVGAGR